MFKYTKDGVSVSVTLDARRAKANGKYPVKVQVTYLRKQKYYATGKDLDRSEWEKLPATKLRTLIDTREQIEASYNIVRDYVRELTDNGNFTFEALSLRLKGAATADVNTAFRVRIEQLEAAEQINTALLYQKTLKAVEAFAGNKILFADITPSWLSRYEQNERKRGLCQTTIAMRISNIRTIVNEAQRLGVVKRSANPFADKRYTIRKGASRKLALRLQQIKAIAKYEGDPTTEKYRDYWLFSYLCNGINTADMAKLKYANIVGDEIVFVRKKTARTTTEQREIHAILTPEMQGIIDRLGNEPHPDNYIFPIIKQGDTAADEVKRLRAFNVSINHYLAKMCDALGIEKITSYTARHSFATTLKRSGANIAYISEALGHSSLQVTQTYLASFEHEERQKNAQILVDILK